MPCEHVPPRLGDPRPRDLDRVPTGDHALGRRRRESGAHAVREHDRLGAAVSHVLAPIRVIHIRRPDRRREPPGRACHDAPVERRIMTNFLPTRPPAGAPNRGAPMSKRSTIHIEDLQTARHLPGWLLRED
jgi:hypothetical protein